MIKSACPLDCYDGCGLYYLKDENRFKAIKDEPVNGTLCAHLYNQYLKEPRILTPRIDGKEVSLEEALDEVAKVIDNKKWLLWRGSGHFGVMRYVTNILAKELNGYITKGSLCDSAGEAGIKEGRGVNKTLPLDIIKNSELIVVWGRNLSVTNSHILPYLNGKKVVVIDPIKTPIAKRASLHLQIKPRSDFYLAILLSRFIYMEQAQDEEWLEKFAPDWEDFYEFTQTFRIKAILEHIGISLDDLGDLLYLLQNHKTTFLVGVGPQKYSIGHYVLWAIDSLAATLGLFGKKDCGVAYLGNSLYGVDNIFNYKLPAVSHPLTPFRDFESIIVQGGNPAFSMPNSNRVKKELEEVENLIYFGLWENETSKLARVVIPAKNFLEKRDLRFSYGHPYVEEMRKALDFDGGVSEYEFTKEILKRFNKEELLRDEDFYINHFISFCKNIGDGRYIVKDYENIPYENGFGEDGDEEFIFIDEFYDDFEDNKHLKFVDYKKEDSTQDYYLITAKAKKSLNSQFERYEYIHLPPNSGFKDGESVVVESKWGFLIGKAKIDDNLRDDCVLIYNSVNGVNRITPNLVSQEGECAIYQEVKVTLNKIKS
ncbi:MAG: molybdopterin-dependent oxidoreductase [Epsilonproteobacteria bacterium]|nr:molybdopterin-dependent oxidoreductase [Campylobacterota bacterium]